MMKVRGQTVIPPRERIAANSEVDPVTGCWNWTGPLHKPPRQYGSLTVGKRGVDRRTVRAHRYSYEIFKGPIPPGLCVCHRCDNPRCVNPDHLFVGTKKDNADDRDAKGRGIVPPHLTGERSSHAKLSDAAIDAIRSSSLSSRKIAPLYGVGDGYIRAIRSGKFRPEPPTLKASKGTGE